MLLQLLGNLAFNGPDLGLKLGKELKVLLECELSLILLIKNQVFKELGIRLSLVEAIVCCRRGHCACAIGEGPEVYLLLERGNTVLLVKELGLHGNELV